MSTATFFRSVNRRAHSSLLFYQTSRRFQSSNSHSSKLDCRRQTLRDSRSGHCQRSTNLQTCVASGVAEAEAPATSEPPAAEPALVTKLDLRVGKILSLEPHPEADALYVEQVDVGEESPRTIISGLVKYVQTEQLQGRSVVVVCNLKPRKMRGIASNGMLLCASNEDHSQVEPLIPPEGALPGQRIHFGEGDGSDQPEPMTPNQVQKKKVFEAAQPDFRTTAQREAAWKDQLMRTPQGPILAPSLTEARIS